MRLLWHVTVEPFTLTPAGGEGKVIVPAVFVIWKLKSGVPVTFGIRNNAP
jgi:hypothetical protein